MNRGELEVVAEFIQERNEARARVAVLEDARETSRGTVRMLSEKKEELEKIRNELLSEKSALTGRVLELQEIATEAGLSVVRKKYRRKK